MAYIYNYLKPLSLKFSPINMLHQRKKQDIEYCPIQLDYKFSKIYTLAQTGDFEHFLNKLDNITNYLYKPKAEFVTCDDINTYYLTQSYQKQCLHSLRNSFISCQLLTSQE
jgi:hypothetical protein